MPRSINAKIPEDLELVLLKALAKDRGDRFSSVQELVDAFDSAARGISPWDEDEAGVAVPIAVAAAGALEPIAVSDGAVASESVLEPIAEPAGVAAALDPIAVSAGGTAVGSVGDPVMERSGVEPPADSAAVADAGSSKRPRRWAWVGGGLVLALLSIVSFGFAMSGSEAGSADEPHDVVAFDQVPPDTFEGAPQGAIDGSPRGAIDGAPRGSIQGSPQGAIPSAWQLVNEDPDNPEAHLELAKALATEGDLAPAKSEFTRASELYIAQANYVSAAESIIIGLELTGANPGDDFRISNILSQAMFLGAESGGMFPSIDVLYAISPEWTPLEALDARSLVYVGETEVAAGMLDRVLGTAPRRHSRKCCHDRCPASNWR